MDGKSLARGVRLFFLVVTAMVTSNCGVDKQFFTALPGGASTSGSTSSSPICNPFGNTGGGGSSGSGGTVGPNNGLIASLYDVSSSAGPGYNSVFDYETYGTLLQSNIFFSQINVPTEEFTSGIGGPGGTPLTDPDGNVLIEWFALFFQSTIQLAATDAPGNYQFAVISDDGSVFEVNTGSGYFQLINDDGQHPSTMACATQPITLNQGTQLPIQFDYFQGPRYNIALILLWRPWPTNNVPYPIDDPACGQSGNDTFFNPDTTPPTPQQLYLDMLSRGWAPVPAQNFFLPGSSSSGGGITNPCNN